MPNRVLGNFKVTYSFCPHSAVLRYAQTLTEMSTKEFPWGKMRPGREADSSAVLVVSNVTVRKEAQNFIPPLSLRNWLRERVCLNTRTGLLLNQKLRLKNFDKNLKPGVLRMHSSCIAVSCGSSSTNEFTLK